jgi:amino acid transporter
MATRNSRNSKGYGFGTAPVFLAGISTILGAVLFLRFGYAVGNAGLFGTLLIILIGHVITIPTAMAIAEIATNLRVEGGGEYFIISRSFGTLVGGTIGISLYFSQAISVAFYMISFAEAFRPLMGVLEGILGFPVQIWMISVPATFLLVGTILKKGASLGVTALWVVVGVLGISLLFFFVGTSTVSAASVQPLATVENPDDFFTVFAIIFPAFTGMTAGVGLSGDLKNPRKSIPLGTLSATLAGMVIYILIAVKLAYSLPPGELSAGVETMSKVSLWGPIIPVGLAAATLSSAIGSILIAPRTMQALAADRIFPMEGLNNILSRGKGEGNDPVNATLFTSVIILVFVSMGSVDFVARIISMFFMITYGSLCLVSFLEHFAGSPSYRPTFRSRWYLSLVGAVACFVMMFQMSPLYTVLAVVAIILIYLFLKRGREVEYDLSAMMRGVLYQLTRRLQVLIQRSTASRSQINWRPSFVAVSSASMTRLAPFDLLRWISRYYGFGTFIHYIEGEFDEKTSALATEKLEELIRQSTVSEADIYVDTVVAPSFRSAISQIVQTPGISGLENNSILFEFHMDHRKEVADIIEGCRFASYVQYNTCVLRSAERHFGYKKKLHIWLTPGDYRNANLIILLAYIILGHSEWSDAEIELFAAFDKSEMTRQVSRLNQLIDKGRIPISHKNVQKVPWNRKKTTFDALVSEHSVSADLVMMGFSIRKLIADGGDFFTRFQDINEILFVRAGQMIAIKEPVE